MTVEEAFKEIERRLAGSWGRADFTVGNDGVARLAPEIIPPPRVTEVYGTRQGNIPPRTPFEKAIGVLPSWDELSGKADHYAAEYERYGDKPVAAPREKTAEERKAEPIYSGVLLYFPDALAAVARVSKAGNDKHNPGQRLHWSRGKSSDQMDANVRHIVSPDHVDPETKEPEINQALWRLLAQVQINEEKRNKARGVRSYSGL